MAEAGAAGGRDRDRSRRRAWAEVDLGAVRHNAALLRDLAAPAGLCAVVKADGYGHGAPAVARAALEGGATWLAVAVVDEGVCLRAAGIDAPVLVLAEPPTDAMAEALAGGLTPTLYSLEGVAAADAAARSAGRVADVHLKVDTGMHRVGASPEHVVEVAVAVERAPGLRLAALWSHLSVADSDDPADRGFTDEQMGRFADAAAALEAAGVAVPMSHLANSAGAIAHPAARLDLVRCGIALYGEPPSAWAAEVLAAGAGAGALRPALTWRAKVSFVRRLPAGARPSYGRRRALPAAATVATVPVGYADGVPRRYFEEGGTVLVGGRPCPLAGAVTMDQIVVDCGPEAEVSVGDEVVLIGHQGEAARSATDWAQTLGTISYEVLCGIGARVPRVVVDAGAKETGT
ncbi:MAG TPA: alanine racemase [Acidimicrobiales bacterium]|nr:alanine racemase [Acidimicrobiales bacterium]